MKQHAITKYLNDNKQLIGLSDWTFTYDNTPIMKEHTLASTIIDADEKEGLVRVHKQFHTLKTQKQHNILLHELVHTRVRVCELKQNLQKAANEEELVNDITRGLLQTHHIV